MNWRTHGSFASVAVASSPARRVFTLERAATLAAVYSAVVAVTAFVR